jgi:RNA polymerase sigma-70 factor, ECF subfamily
MADLRDQLISEIPRLRRLARGLARDRDIADDLVQDTLVRALCAENPSTKETSAVGCL